MKTQHIIRAGITASLIVHLTILVLVVFFADVHPFGSVTAETIAVDIVTPKEVVEVPKEPEPTPTPTPTPLATPSLEIPTFAKPETSRSPAPAPASASTAPAAAAASAQAAAPPQKQATPPSPAPDRQQAAAQPPQQPQSSQPPPPSAMPSAITVQPDLTVKYNVALGLPSPSDGFDAPASAKADVASNLVTEFRRHLRNCSKLPDSIAPTDKVKIKLRVFMTPDGKLNTDPVLIEASASAKGPLLMQSAIGALQACQPYTMLPSDRYGEWKMLDLIFTPQDFAGG
jgi:hypothetical protein